MSEKGEVKIRKIPTIGFLRGVLRHLLAVMACGWVSFLLFPALTTSTAEGASGYYSIHVSTFKGVKDSGHEVSRLQGQGFEAFYRIESIEGKGEMYRIYVGRYAAREEAKNASEAMKQKGLISYYAIKLFADEAAPPQAEAAAKPITTPTKPLLPPASEAVPPRVIETAHVPAPPVKEGNPAESPHTPKLDARGGHSSRETGLVKERSPSVSGARFFSIHVSTFKGVKDSGHEVSRLKGHGCEAFYRVESIEGKGEMYRIYVGRYATREAAKSASEAMKQKGFITWADVKSFRNEDVAIHPETAAPVALGGDAVLPDTGPMGTGEPQAELSHAVKEETPLPDTGPTETAETAQPQLELSPPVKGETPLAGPGPVVAAPRRAEPSPAVKEKTPPAPPDGPSMALEPKSQSAPGAFQDKPPEAGAVSEGPATAPPSPPVGEAGGKGHNLNQRSRDILRIPMERRPYKEIVRLSLLEAIRYSLAGNKDMEIASYEPQQATEDVTRSNSVYDPSFFLEDKQTRGPNVNSTLDNVFIEDSTLLKSGIRQPLTTGGSLSLFMEMDYFDTRNSLLDRKYRYTSAPVIELRQPLLKNVGGMAEKSAIQVANCSLNISEENFRQTVIDTVTRVTQAYWMLYLHQEFLKIHRENLKMAEEVYRREFYRMDQGLSKELDVERAKAASEERRGNLLRSEERLRVTMDLLKNELNWSNLKIDSAAEILPIERPRTLPVEVDESQTIQKALLNRPEIFKTQKNLEIAVIREDLSSHERLPNLDAFARYGGNGYGREFSNSVDEIGTGDRNSWVVGVTLEFPIGNRSANALHRRRILEKKQKMADIERVENQVKREVKEALHGLDLAKGEIDSTLSRMESAEKVVEGEFARFDLGQVTNEELLRAQDLLTNARREFVRSVIDYNISLAELNRAQGILIEGVALQKTAGLHEEPVSRGSRRGNDRRGDDRAAGEPPLGDIGISERRPSGIFWR